MNFGEAQNCPMDSAVFFNLRKLNGKSPRGRFAWVPGRCQWMPCISTLGFQLQLLKPANWNQLVEINGSSFYFNTFSSLFVVTSCNLHQVDKGAAHHVGPWVQRRWLRNDIDGVPWISLPAIASRTRCWDLDFWVSRPIQTWTHPFLSAKMGWRLMVWFWSWWTCHIIC